MLKEVLQHPRTWMFCPSQLLSGANARRVILSPLNISSQGCRFPVCAVAPSALYGIAGEVLAGAARPVLCRRSLQMTIIIHPDLKS